MKVLFVVNPNAAAGRVHKNWDKIHSIIKQKFTHEFEVTFTERPMHAIELTRQGIHNDCSSIIAVGGDGTLNEVVNGFFQDNQLIKNDVSLGVLEIGTGGAAYIALKTDVPIFPVTLTGTENARIFGNLKRLRRTHVTITIGEPFRLEKLTTQRKAVMVGTEKIMRTLANQLPRSYRGQYSRGI